MRPQLLGVLALALALAPTGALAAKPAAKSPPAMVTAGGVHRPLFPSSATSTVTVPTFRLDRLPVTNGDYLRFVQARREWSRDRVERITAEPGYLGHWAASDALGPQAEPEQPVVNVSWFAARAYCAFRGARLPTEAEWELVAAASPTKMDGATDPAWRAELLALYARPAPARLPHVGAGVPNYWGAQDMHGLVWEWVLDFNSAIAAFKSGSDGLRFCGATGSSARDATDFVAFERTALRSSLQASFVVRNLGFRCAADLQPGTVR
jgi:formylglycine-generating enzyme